MDWDLFLKTAILALYVAGMLLIALIAVTNVFNTISTGVMLRKREFAMIQSIGMTKKQLCKMLVHEGVD